MSTLSLLAPSQSAARTDLQSSAQPAPRAAQRLSSYSRLRHASPREVLVAQDVDQVQAALRRADQAHRRVTLRAGGRSLDDQALNDDTVIDVAGLNGIVSLDVARREITVQPSASWGAILDATLPHGLVPHILVTTRGATAGGTLAANCVSRSSPRYGHVGDHVRSLRLLTVAGERLTCSREENAEIFRAVIGGFGWFGVVIEATFDLLEVGARRNVRTVIERREGLQAFTERLTELSQNPAPHDAVYSVYSLRAPQRGAILCSSYTDEPVGRTLFLYQGAAWFRTPAELLFVSSRVSSALGHAAYKWAFNRGPFVDDLRGYTFCMEGNERAKAATERFGVKMTSVQHSYTVPAERLHWFLQETARRFAAHDVYPALMDALYLPSDEFLLSSSRGSSGFCCSFIFEGVTGAKFARLHRCLLEINDVCLEINGRLHLVKNVYATQEQLGRMYASSLSELKALKQRLDPRSVLVNDFYLRAFG